MIMDSIERYKRDKEFQIAEASERQREHLLQEFQVQALAASRIALATEDVAAEISRMAAIADWALPAIAEHLAMSAERLGGIEQMLANPTETAAAEYYRRGSYALASGWLEEAETDLAEAVRLYPYNPRIWFNLGVARQRVDSFEAAEAFTRSARYAATSDTGLAARAVLLGSGVFRAHNRVEDSERLLREYSVKLDRCAELHLALGVHHDDLEHLVLAMTIAPDLAVDARLSDCTLVEDAAIIVCQSDKGPVVKLREIEERTSDLFKEACRAGFEGICSPPARFNVPASGFDGLLVSHTSMPVAVGAAGKLTQEIQQEQLSRVLLLDEIARRIQSMRASLVEAEQMRQAIESRVAELGAELCLGRTWSEDARVEELTETAARQLLEAELTRACALEKIITTVPDMYAHWTDSNFADNMNSILLKGNIVGNASLANARTWIDVHTWIVSQAYLRMSVHANDSSFRPRSCMVGIFDDALEQAKQQVQEIESALANASRQTPNGGRRLKVAATEIRNLAANAAAPIPKLPDGATQAARDLHDALPAAQLAATQVLALAEAADRQGEALGKAHEESWRAVHTLALRVHGETHAMPLVAELRARMEAEPDGSYVPETVRDHLRDLLVIPARTKEAECKRNLAAMRIEEQRAASLVRVAEELTAKAMVLAKGVRGLAAPEVRLSPF
jgi:tetratricopeptide (TPR) repeat protein